MCRWDWVYFIYFMLVCMGTHASRSCIVYAGRDYLDCILIVYMLSVMHWHCIGVYVLGRFNLYFVGFVRLKICDIYKSLFIYPTRINS